MTKIVTAHSTSLDGCIAGADDRPEQPLGVGGDRLFTWFSDGDTPSRYYPGFKMSAVSAAFFEEGVGGVGAVIAGCRTYDISEAWGSSGSMPGPTTRPGEEDLSDLVYPMHRGELAAHDPP